MTPASYWKQVREAEAKATPGPWNSKSVDGESIESVWMEDGTSLGSVVATCSLDAPKFEFHAPQARDDAAFIALSRTALPLALARIEELEAALTKAADDLENAVGYVPEYFQDKWDMADDIKAARAALGKP